MQDLQEKVTKAKALYSKSLRNLEEISESIHARRKLKQLWSHKSSSIRQPGVGAELDYDLVISLGPVHKQMYCFNSGNDTEHTESEMSRALPRSEQR